MLVDDDVNYAGYDLFYFCKIVHFIFLKNP